MERHRCKLCSKVFCNGRALGGHMRSHLAILPLPCNKISVDQFSDRTESDSSSSFNLTPNVVGGHVTGFLHANEQLLDAGSVVLQETESETESTHNPTRRRSKRKSRGKMTSCGSHQILHGADQSKKWLKKMDHHQRQYVRVKSESVTESALVSSVSDACLVEEVALCLMMLSRDVWEKRVEDINSVDSAELGTSTRLVTRFPQKLNKSKKMKPNRSLVEVKNSDMDHNMKLYECPFCGKVFGSGQALGGHKRSHLLGSSSTSYNTKEVASNNNNNNDNSNNVGDNDKVIGDTSSFILDLNLPAPLDDGEDIS